MISVTTDNWRIDGIRGVLFDKDGTLVDSHVYWGRIIERRASAIIDFYGFPKKMHTDLCLSMGYSLESKRLRPEGPIALVSREDVIDAVVTFLKNRSVAASASVLSGLFVREHDAFLDEIFEFIRILPGVRDILEKLKENGVKAAVVTTDTVKNTDKILRYLEIDDFFTSVIGRESTTEEKITGVPAITALTSLELQCDSVICIGDAPMDLKMAQKSNLKAGIGVATGQITSDVLLGYSQYTVESLQQLIIHNDRREIGYDD